MDATCTELRVTIERNAIKTETKPMCKPIAKESNCKETKIANADTAKEQQLEKGYPKEIRAKYRSKVTSRRASPLFLLLRIKMDCNLFALVFCLILSCVGAKEQKFAIEPQDQSAVVGSRVTLPCRVENKAGQLQWTKDDFGLGTHRHLTGYERYRMIGSDEEGDYSLDIREVTLEDDAMYQCQVSTGSRGETAIRSRYARLTVLVPPEPPRILQGSAIETVEDQDVSMECVSVGGKPPAEITWVDHDGGVLTQGVTYTVEPMSDGRRFTARSILSIRPRRNHHNQTFTCQAQNTADRAYRATTIKLEVKYAPKIRMFAKTSRPKGRIQEGDTLSMVCHANANPVDLSYKWFINNEQFNGFYGNELVVNNVSRKYNDASIKCEVYNSVGKSAESKTLEVTYGPSFLIKPQDVEAEDGTEVTLSCLVDGHPQPDLLWLHVMKERIVNVGKTPNLTLTASHQSAGQYWCRANVEGYPHIEAYATVYVKGPPKILSNKTQYGIEGDSVRVDCISLSVPKPDYVMWTFGGHEINSFHNQEYAFLEETLQDGMTKSTLIIRDSHARHFGIYNCSVTNLYGSDSVEIRLVPDKSFPLIVIISGGASSAVLVLIIMLIIMLCHRRRRKNLPTEIVKKPDITDLGRMNCGDQCKGSDRSSNISDLKMELRQVEGSCEMETTSTAETEFHSNMHLSSNLGLPLAGPVHLPSTGYDNELMKQLQRYSHDFGDANHLQFKTHGQSNGYVPYVDYSRDYIPPVIQSSDSLSGSMSRSIDTASTAQYNSGQSQNGSLQRIAGLSGFGGPDVIPMSNQCLSGSVDVRYAATYGNPYLRVNGPVSYVPQVNTANPATTPAPPPYYSVKNTTLPPPPVTSLTSPSSQSSRSCASQVVSSSSHCTSTGAQPQVPKSTPPSSGALYILPTHQGGCQTQITTKGNGQLTTGTHV